MDPTAAAPLNRILTSQFQAALLMLRECIERCPEAHWDSLIARYTFWQVAYHTLCMVDCRLDLSDDAWQPHPIHHPAGRADLEDEYPSRRFTRPELLAYFGFCLEKLTATIPSETAAALSAPAAGFPFSRAWPITYPRTLPLRPAWLGLAGNTALYTALWWLMLVSPPALRRALRRRRGRCARCGYDLSATAPGGPCPECGAASLRFA